MINRRNVLQGMAAGVGAAFGSTVMITIPPLMVLIVFQSAIGDVGILMMAVLIAGFVAWELRSDHPMLDPRLFRQREFALGSTAIASRSCP